MLIIPGYTFIDELYTSRNEIMGRYLRQSDEKKVILKSPNTDSPSNREITSLEHEYYLLTHLTSPNIIQAYQIIQSQLIPVIELEDIKGERLDVFLKGQPLPLAQFFPIALQLVDLLAMLHQNHIIHKDIKPANIFIDTETLQIKLVDLSVAVQVTEEIQEQTNLDLLEGAIEGTLAYMSPEQTGRMNRPIDYRTDLYSLGVTLFEMLTGELPFREEDPLELAYDHLAKLPPHISTLNSEIPEMLEKLVEKLLSKAPEERYTHAIRLKADLQKCADEWQKYGEIKIFPLGQHDVQDKLQFSHKLYGREKQIKMLLNVFDIVTRGASRLMLISGHTGIGKTSIINEIYKPITRQRGFFLKGKFERLQRSTPYSAVITAFQDLVKQVLVKPESELQEIKNGLQEALGRNGQVIIDVIPKVELLIGPQEGLPDLSPIETQNRFYFAFQSFVQFFAQAEHPLVIFLDDLQWADSASLKLIDTLLLKFDTHHLLIIGAYRNNEVDSNHPLALLLQKFRSTNTPVETISLEPLKTNDVKALLKDLFKSFQESLDNLVELLINKTQGNPFFINEFIVSLYKHKLISFSYDEEKWFWDLSKIDQQKMTDNVVELLTTKIHRLTHDSQEALKLAASIGHTFDLRTLSAICEQPLSQTAVQLGEARLENLIVPVGSVLQTNSEAFRLAILAEENITRNGDQENDRIIYKFVHDRIYQTAYELIPEQEREKLHFRIGQLLLEDKALEENDERLFGLLDHLNKGLALVKSSKERRQLVLYNLWAGKKAKLSTAYEEAQKYFETGISCLSHDAWENQYEDTLLLFKYYIECLYLLGQFDKADRAFESVVFKAKSRSEKADFYLLRMQAYASVGEHLKAIEYAIQALDLFNFHVPVKVNRFHVLYEIWKIRWLLRGRSVKDLEKSFVPVTEEDDIVIAKLLSKIIPSSFLTANSNLLALIVCTLVRLSLTKGYDEETSYVYLNFASILIAQLDKLDLGFDFVNLSKKLEMKLSSKDIACRNNMMIGTFLDTWRHHALKAVPYLEQSFKLGLEIGNLETAIYVQRIPYIHFYTGKKLAESNEEIKRFIHFSAKIKNSSWHSALLAIENINEYLQKGPDKAADLKNNMLAIQKIDIRSLQAVTFALYSIFLYLIGDFSQSFEYTTYFQHVRIAIKGIVIDSAFGWLALSLGIIKLYPKSSKKKKKVYLKQLLSNQRKFKKWARYSPSNFEFMYLWISAEIERLQENYIKANSLYNGAVEAAQKNGYIPYVGAICESAAQYYLDLNAPICAEAYMKRAYFAYQRWGADYKCQLLKEQYPQFITPIESAKQDVNSFALTKETFDISTVMKSSQALSSEIHLEKLLETLLKMALKNAGAQKGVLLFEQDNKLIIVAQISEAGVTSINLDGLPLERYEGIPKSIINYVWHANENLLLNSVSEIERFHEDPYIAKYKPNSILCFPILLHGRSTGYLYLENRLTPYAFTPESLHVLRLLGGQTAISLENAKLYSAIGRFVPYEFLKSLKKSNLAELKLGDHIAKEMSILFCDIRNFTSISENLDPAKVFEFINDFFGYLEPDIRKHHGFVDKYIGDAIMALFDRADDAVKAGIDMLKTVDKFNEEMKEYLPIRIGIGINTGNLMLGIIGQKNRIEGSVLGDAVNVASRIQNLTKQYGENLLISEDTQKHLHPKAFILNVVGEVKIRGKASDIKLFSVQRPDESENI